MADDQKKDAGKPDEGEKKSSPMKMIIINALVIFIAAGAGAAAGFTVFKPAGETEDNAKQQKEKQKQKDEFDLGTAMSDKTKNETELFELDPLVANLDVPQQNRYIKAKITLVVKKAIFLKLKPILDKKKEAICERIRIYLLSLTLGEVRGEKNVRKRKREIRKIINQEFMPDKKPLVDHILFSDWTVS